MAIITSIGVVALASMAAILINDYTSVGGHLEDGDDNFSVFSRPVAAVAETVKIGESQNEASKSPSKEVALV